MRKLLSVLLSIALAISLVGCGTAEDATKQTTEKQTTTEHETVIPMASWREMAEEFSDYRPSDVREEIYEAACIAAIVAYAYLDSDIDVYEAYDATSVAFDDLLHIREENYNEEVLYNNVMFLIAAYINIQDGNPERTQKDVENYMNNILDIMVYEESQTSASETEHVTEAPTPVPTEPPTQKPTEPPTPAPTQPPTEPPTEKPTPAPTQSPTQPPTEPPTEAPKPSATIGQQNALKEANNYLKYLAFSRQDLIEQLEYEGYTYEECIYAVDNCGADWNEQALKSAKNYLDSSSFSYSGLIEQLEYEQFTSEQAKYGVDNCGADWNEQAAKSAQSYLKYMAFSKQDLIEQLEYEGFTHEQAVYGAESNGY